MGADRGNASAYALLSGGATIEIRAALPEDFDAVRDMHAKMSPDNLYLRFFSMSPLAAEQEARRICRQPGPDHAALLAVLDGAVAGCGAYEGGPSCRTSSPAASRARSTQDHVIVPILAGVQIRRHDHVPARLTPSTRTTNTSGPAWPPYSATWASSPAQPRHNLRKTKPLEIMEPQAAKSLVPVEGPSL